MPSHNLLELKAITKDYLLGKTKVSALRGVDLEVSAGEFTVVTGPSGSGKTTLLNIIGCLDRATSGSYKLDGEEVGDRDFDALADVRNRKIGFIFQSFNLIPVLDVAENIEFPCMVRKDTEELGFTMASEPKTGALLAVLAASKPGGQFLELGTGTGLGTAWLLSGMDADAACEPGW